MRSKKKRNIISNLIWSLKELCKFKKIYALLFILQAVINGILPVVSLVLIQQIVDDLQYKTTEIKIVIVKLLFMTLFQLFCNICLNYIQLILGNLELKFNTYFQAKILEKVSMLDSKDFENIETYNLINRTQYDGNAGILGTIKILFAWSSMFISVVSYIVIIIQFNVVVFLVITMLPLIRYFFEKKYNLEEYDINIKNTETDRKTNYISFLLTNSEKFKEIKSYDLFHFFIKKYEEIKKCYNQEFIRLYNRRTKTYSIISVINGIIDCSIVLMILIQTFWGILSIGDFILYNNTIDSLKESIMSLFSQASYIYKNSAMIEQIRSFFEIIPEDIHQGGIIIDKITKIELKNVSYKYQGKEGYVLKKINLKFTQEDFVVLLGYNGSGKSTLIKIIMGIYSDYEGDIFVNDINLKEINLEEYRKKVSVMFQDYIKYESSIKDNVWYGNIKCKNDYAIGRMLDKVRMQNLKKQLNQSLGYQFTNGIQISIGQWQKLALSRALFKPADMYIFDEPNASLDIASEKAILNAIWEEKQGKITILIIHRFNCMLEKADKIVVLENGEIVEVGTHGKLLENGKLYAQLYSMQKEMSISEEG